MTWLYTVKYTTMYSYQNYVPNSVY